MTSFEIDVIVTSLTTVFIVFTIMQAYRLGAYIDKQKDIIKELNMHTHLIGKLVEKIARDSDDTNNK